MEKGKKRKRQYRSSSEEEDDPPPPPPDGDIIDKLYVIDEKVGKILQQLTLPTLIFQTFKCTICHASPLTPPAIFACCCKRILGCQECTTQWYREEEEEGASKPCPLCRADNGSTEIKVILGLDEFLETAHRLRISTPTD